VHPLIKGHGHRFKSVDDEGRRHTRPRGVGFGASFRVDVLEEDRTNQRCSQTTRDGLGVGSPRADPNPKITEATAVSAPTAGRHAILPAVFSSPGAIAVQIGPVVIRWYGILMATAIVVGLGVGHRPAKREGLPADETTSRAHWA